MTTPENQPLLQTEDMNALIARAQAGDSSCLPELRALLASRPNIWFGVGDLAGHVEMSLIRLVAGSDLLAQESIRLKVNQIKTELSGPAMTPLEKLLIDRIGLCWLAVHQADLMAARNPAQGESSLGGKTQRKLDAAHQRYLTAVRQLASVRKLLGLNLKAKGTGKASTTTIQLREQPKPSSRKDKHDAKK